MPRPPDIAPPEEVAPNSQRSWLVVVCDNISLRHVAYLVAGVVVLATSMQFTVASARAYFRRTKTTGQFSTVALALHNYHDTFGHFPKPIVVGTHGEDIWSWRWELNPYLERSGDYDDGRRRDEPWDSRANRALWDLEGRGYRFCYPDAGHVTCILAVTGPGTVFGNRDDPAHSLNDIDRDTILLAEARYSGYKWPQPKDIDIRSLGQQGSVGRGNGLSSRHENGFHVAFADGAVWFIRNDVPIDRLRPFLTIEGARKLDRDKELSQYCLAATRPVANVIR